jgi:signal transduction histidine kinase
VKERVTTPLDSGFSEAVEQLLREGRRSKPLPPERREIVVDALSGAVFLMTAIAMAVLLPVERSFSLGLVVAFTIAYSVLASIRFEVGVGSTSPTQVLFVPMLFAVPTRTVPLVIACALLLSAVPDYLTGRMHVGRAISVLNDSWFAVGPALILSLARVDGPAWSDWPLYVSALAAQLAINGAASIGSEWLCYGATPRVQLQVLGWVFLVDVLLSPVGLLVAFASTQERYAFLLVLPLVGLFAVFATERRARINNALGLSRAYRDKAELNARLLETERAASRAREELIAGASHEMQTPLAVLLGLLDATGREALPPERQTEVHASMRRQAIRLRHLVRQFVDYTRLKAGRSLHFDPRPSNVKPIVEEVADSHRGYAQIELDLPEDLPLAVVDPDRLHQVLMSLVSNAVKFSPDGSRTTIAALSRGTSIEISVIDRGSGIDAAEVPHLFEEFHRGQDKGGDDAGAGLGLFMVRVLTETQGAHITVESRPGEGSRFTIVLPRVS